MLYCNSDLLVILNRKVCVCVFGRISINPSSVVFSWPTKAERHYMWMPWIQ